jgi:hypothetical protein
MNLLKYLMQNRYSFGYLFLRNVLQTCLVRKPFSEIRRYSKW